MTSLGALFELYGMIFDREYYTPCASGDHTQGKLKQLKPVLEYMELNYQSPITLGGPVQAGRHVLQIFLPLLPCSHPQDTY